MKKALFLFVRLVPLFLFSGDAGAQLNLTINEIGPDILSFTISGTFQEDVVGNSRHYLALKADWLENIGVNVPWIANSLGETYLDVFPGVTENTISFDGNQVSGFINSQSSSPYGDSIYFIGNGPIGAGTAASGTLTITGDGIFDFSNVESLQLVSGYNNPSNDWARLEASAPVPEPSAAALCALALGAMGLRGRRR